MNRRSFIAKLVITLAGSFVQLQKTFAQSLPFGFWRISGSYGELRATQAILAAAAFGGANAEMRATQTILVTAGVAGANAEMRVTQALLATAGTAGSDGPLRATQAMLVVAAKI